MKKSILKISLTLIFVFCIVASLFSINCFAADTTLIFSSNKVTVGDKVSVTFNVKGSQMTIVNLSVSYDSSVLKYVSGADSGGAGILSLVRDFAPTDNKSFTIEFSTLKSGSAQIGVSGTKYHGAPPNDAEVAISGASAVLQVMDVALSSNTNLKALSLSAGTLSPNFSPSVTTYNVNVKNDVSKCDIYATAEDSGAKISVSGNSALNVGTNTRVVTVTAPSGDIKKYTVNIIRSEVDNSVSVPAPAPEVPEEPEEPEINPLEITEGEFQNYVIASDLSKVELFKGFEVKKVQYNETEIDVATDSKGEYELYFLNPPEDGDAVICTYDEESKTFNELFYIVQGDYAYIIADMPDGFTIPDSYYSTNTTIAEKNIKCFTNISTPDFYYMYCYADGKYGFYRFDSIENVLQRYPELEPTKEVVEAPVETKDNILDRFNSLSTNSKVILIGLIVVALALIALIVLFIVKLVKKRKDNDDEEFDSSVDFDDISINDNFFITDSDKNQTDESDE